MRNAAVDGDCGGCYGANACLEAAVRRSTHVINLEENFSASDVHCVGNFLPATLMESSVSCERCKKDSRRLRYQIRRNSSTMSHSMHTILRIYLLFIGIYARRPIPSIALL